MGKKLSEVLLEGQITHPTLKKYVGMGLLPRPQIVRGGSRGSSSVYPDSVVGLIHTIETLKAQGHTLDDIRGLLSAQKEVSREVLAVKPNRGHLTRVLDAWPDWAPYVILAILPIISIVLLWMMSGWILCNCDDYQRCTVVGSSYSGDDTIPSITAQADPSALPLVRAGEVRENGSPTEHEEVTYLWTMSSWMHCNCDDYQYCKTVFDAEPTAYVEGGETAIYFPCGMTILRKDIETERLTSEYKGKTCYFCSPGCKSSFMAEPEKYIPQNREKSSSG